MTWILRSAFAVAALLLVGNAAPETDETICVGGRGWHPSLADGAAIEAVPVPAGYRLLFESKEPCGRWGLYEGSLVDWHLRFGSERSIGAALGYLEQDYKADLPRPERYRDELERAWRLALPDLRRAAALPQPKNLNYSVKFRFIETSRSVQDLRRLIGARDKYLFLAEEHLRAAEEFGSIPFLEKAGPVLGAAVEGGKLLEPLETEEPAAKLLSLDLDLFKTDDFQMRMAVLRARLTRSATDLSRAEAIVRSAEGPAYRRLAEAAYSEGGGFCDISSGWGNAEQLRSACEADDAIKERVTNYWINRATLDLVSDAIEKRSDEVAFQLLEREKSAESGRCCRRSAEEDLLALRLQRAEYHRRRLAAAVTARNESGKGQSWYSALEDLHEAERLAPIVSGPTRFRRVATAWLDIWQSGDTVFDRSERRVAWMGSPERWRFATYLRRLLGGSDSIAKGADAGVRPLGN